jgi:hypothetical protein
MAMATMISVYSSECDACGNVPPAARSTDSPTTGSIQRSSAATGPTGSTAGMLNQPPTTLRIPSTTSGPVMIQGASRRCSRSLSPVRFGPWKV